MTAEKTVTFGDGRMAPICEVRFWIVTDSGGGVNPCRFVLTGCKDDLKIARLKRMKFPAGSLQP